MLKLVCGYVYVSTCVHVTGWRIFSALYLQNWCKLKHEILYHNIIRNISSFWRKSKVRQNKPKMRPEVNTSKTAQTYFSNWICKHLFKCLLEFICHLLQKNWWKSKFGRPILGFGNGSLNKNRLDFLQTR